MEKKFLYPLLIIALYVVLSIWFSNLIIPVLFLSATLAVSAIGIISGYKMGFFSSIIISILVALNLQPNLSNQDILIRYCAFLVTSGILTVISQKIKSYERTRDERLSIYGAIVESSDDAIIGKTLDGTITSWNKGAERLFGFTEEEAIGNNITMIFPSDRTKEEAEIISKIRSGEKIMHYETMRKKKDGTVFPVSLTVSPIVGEDGRIIGASKIVRDISLRWDYERNLKESDERYRSFIQNSSEGIWRVELSEPISILQDPEEIINQIFERAYFAECNLAMARMYGYASPSQIVGQKLQFLLPDTDKTRGYLRAFIESDYNLEEAESEEVGINGQTLYFTNALVAMVEDSKIHRAWGVQRDITERRLQAEMLERSKERYKAFIENSEEAIWMIEYRPPIDTSAPLEDQLDAFFRHGYIMEANATMRELYKLGSEEDVIGKPSAIASVRTESGEEFLKQFIENGYSISDYESHTVDEKGNHRYGSSTFKAIIHEGKILRGWVVQRETTEQKIQEDAIKKSEERYKTFIENSDEAICRIEFRNHIDTSLPVMFQIEKFFAEGYIAEANVGTSEIMGVPVEDLINTPLYEVDIRTEHDKKFLKQFIENGYTIKDYESQEERKGKENYHSSSLKGIIENGKWIRAWLVRRDITSKKEAEIERERLLQQAEEAKRNLEIASVEKDRFLANLSHELRTPLVAILGYSAMLMDSDPDGESAKKMIATINKNAKLQVQLIEDLLDLSRIISGKIELKKDFFNSEELCRDCVDTFRKQATDKGLRIVEKYDSCMFYGDKKRLTQVVLNLLSNAVKFTEKGDVFVTTRCTEDYLTISVKDTGIGIDPKNIEKLFQPFKQLDSSSTRAKQGLGLGLSIVKNITDLHNGKVTVESKLGEGSEFSVYLPVTQTPVVEEQEQIHVTPSATFDDVAILIVEDDPDSAGFVKYLYEQKGATVDWAESAKKGREYIEKKKYDLYIFDLSMPEEDGLSLIKSVRAKGDATKSVALTAFADSFYEKTALESGFDMFLKKPSSLSDLLSVIKLIR